MEKNPNEPRLGASVLSVEAACAYAISREVVGDYEGACAILGSWWKPGQEPCLDGLDRRAAAELLLRVGTVNGWLDSTQNHGTQNKHSQYWISKSLALFEVVGAEKSIAECHMELGHCYYREGALDLAYDNYQIALSYLQQSDHKELCIITLLRRAVVEQVSTRLRESKATLEQAAQMLQPEHSVFLHGRFFNNYALTIQELGKAENNIALLKEASAYFSQAGRCFEQAGSLRSCALVLNNLGMLLMALGQSHEAEQHFNSARHLFVELKDIIGIAHINESRARLFLTVNRYEEGATAVAEAVKTFRESREDAFLAEALTTQGITYARLNRWVEARYSFNEALHTAERCADLEGAGRAALSLVEEMCDRLTLIERRDFFARAEYLLGATQSSETRERIRACGQLVAAAEEEERKRREQEIHSEKMASLGQLAFGVAHNFNNALTIIKGRTQIIQMTSLPEKVEKNLGLILETVDDSVAMIRRIRDFGRPRTDEDFIRLDLMKLLGSAVEMTRPRCAEQGISLNWEPPEPVFLRGDMGELREVFVNLIYNAVDALAGPGAITVSATLKGENIELRFTDTGPGMTKEVRSRIFEPFFTTKGGKGTGLGLATAHSVIRSHTGIIEVESIYGAGATFKITLPLNPPKLKTKEITLPLMVGEHRHLEAALTV